MKQFQAPFISDTTFNNDLNQVSLILGHLEKQNIDNLLWSNNGYKPEVSFCMGHTNNGILLKFHVEEKYIKASYQNINDPVHKDTCVEFFIAFNNEPSYYNLEFNCLGIVSAGYGPEQNGRIPVKDQLLEKIESSHHIEAPLNDNELFNWELTLYIPFNVFEFHAIESLVNQVCNVNFYKCGDELPEPHYLSWNYINNPTPNFHLPEFFGKVIFSI